MADEDEKANSELGDVDDWLADLDDDQKESPVAGDAKTPMASDDFEINQPNSDKMLKADDEPSAGSDDADDLGSAGGLDGIDNAVEPPELNQNRIDSLFNEKISTTEGKPAKGKGDTEDDFAEIFGDAASGDSLSAELEVPETPPNGSPPPKQEAKKEVEDAFSFDHDEFDLEGLDFDDSIPDIPDEFTMGSVEGQQDADSASYSDSQDALAGSFDAVKSAKFTLPDNQQQPDQGKKFFTRPPSINPKIIGAATFALLALAGIIYLLLGQEDQMETAISPMVREQAVQPVEPERLKVVSPPPVAHGKLYHMEEPGAAIVMELRADSADQATLSFEIVTPPRHGRLVGKPPLVAYLPDRDFPGEDGFVFLATDGHLVSNHAEVIIIDRSLPAVMDEKAPKEVMVALPVLTPSRPLLRARDFILQTSSIDPLLIDWAVIWRRDNAIPFSPRVKVEIIEQDLKGKLIRLSAAAHRYESNPYFYGAERLLYRFHYAGVRSRLRQLTIEVGMGDPPPMVRIRPVAATYVVGETVVIDARDTLAARPQDLRFAWKQLSGTPVLLETSADNAVVRFIAPSAFSSVETPRVLLQVTAIDPAGRQDVKTVEITTTSRRHGALWQGEERDKDPKNVGRASPLWGF